MRLSVTLAAIAIAGCEIAALPSEELRAKPPAEDFVLKGDLGCVYEKSTAYLATVIAGFDKDFRGYMAPDQRSAWLRHPLVLFDLDALKDGGTRVRRRPVGLDTHFGDGLVFSEWLKKLDCPGVTRP